LKKLKKKWVFLETLYSDQNGQFSIKAQIGDVLSFRKKGYSWHNVEIKAEDMQIVYLRNSSTVVVKNDLGPNFNRENTEIIYDGFVVPFEEWRDSYSMHGSQFVNLEIISGNFQKQGDKEVVIKKTQIIIQSIFQWNNKSR
jgi:hypothetical protein